jgi:formate hydrogenlyase subunit 3/multisubunit Na+/H+ antiporter MnhD subunit
MMLILLFKLSLAFSLGIFVFPKRWKHAFGSLLHIIIITCSSAWAITAFQSDEPVRMSLEISTWSGPMILVIDHLSAFFILIINMICLCVLIYAGGYLKPYMEKKRAAIISAHLFSFLWLHASMLMVASFRDGIAFLLAWELMSLFSFILVIFEGQKENILKTGINYLLQMHLGFALIMLGFLIGASSSGDISFDALREYFSNQSNTSLYLLFFAGFGIKAGFIPLHTWLPRAHPAAPSHVSAVMSGVMIKMGIYGILRVTTYVQNDWFTIGIWVLLISIVSGILGVIMAILQHDLKRLLAYHSIENIGIIGIGLAIALIGKSYNDPYLYALGLSGALLHTLNHALFKSLLFFSAGNVFYSTHTVNMDHLGGLAKQMPYSSIIFITGALAISGIPPFNGFISEFLIYNGVITNMATSGFSMSVIGIITMLSLVMIGGLCIYCFTKAAGLSFLGTRRSEQAHVVKEVPFIMLIPAVLLIGMILSIGLLPQFFGKLLLHILPVFNATIAQPASDNLLLTLRSIGLVNVTLIIVGGGISLIRYFQQARITKTTGPTWGCGYSAGDFRHQYTPTSYAESLREIIQPVVLFKKHYQEIEETEIFPERRSFHTESKDLLEEKTILKSVNFIVQLLPKAGVAQTGVINHYLVYPLLFLIIIGLLTLLNVI